MCKSRLKIRLAKFLYLIFYVTLILLKLMNSKMSGVYVIHAIWPYIIVFYMYLTLIREMLSIFRNNLLKINPQTRQRAGLKICKPDNWSILSCSFEGLPSSFIIFTQNQNLWHYSGPLRSTLNPSRSLKCYFVIEINSFLGHLRPYFYIIINKTQ